MNQRGRRGRGAKWLALFMLVALLCGSTVMAQESGSNYWPYVGITVAPGTVIKGVSAGGSSGLYVDYDFFVNGEQYFGDSNGNVHLNGYFEVQEIRTDSVNKRVDITGERMIEIKTYKNSIIAKKGGSYTVDLSEEWKEEIAQNKDNKFIKWWVWVEETNGSHTDYTLEESAAFLGVSEAQLQNPACSLTFTVPSAWIDNGYRCVGINPAFDGDSTVSGNVPPSGGDDSTVSGNGSSGLNGNGGGNTEETAATEPAVRKNVVLSDGTTLTSISAMHNEAYGINGAAVMTPQEDMNTAAGISPQAVEAGSRAKLYMGNTYKAAEKTMLTDAVTQTGAKAVQMINIDLYAIAKNGKIDRVAGGEKSVRVVIGLPLNAVKDGRSFSLVYMGEDGKAVEIEDLDDDPRTLTVDLTRFGSFAIVYR